MGTDFRRVSAVDDFSVMGASYGITGSRVDAMDVLKVYEAVKTASTVVREQQTPTFVEMLTYRYKGHSMTDPAKYRTREELEEYRQKDPILILRGQMLAANLLSEDEYKAMDDAVNERVADAVEFAENSAEPPLETMYEDILA
jgi:pyruvate dehydrogenase E1 component alpha subunit